MDIGADGIVSTIASSTSAYFAVYAPIFLLMGGLMLALGIIATLIAIISQRQGGADSIDMDDAMEF